MSNQINNNKKNERQRKIAMGSQTNGTGLHKNFVQGRNRGVRSRQHTQQEAYEQKRTRRVQEKGVHPNLSDFLLYTHIFF